MAVKILLADDDAISRAVLKDILKAEPSWEIIEAPDGLAAWDLLDKGLNPVLCVIDIKMPGLDGAELVQKMRSSPHLRDLPVIIISSVRNRETILALAKLGISGYLMKPFAAVRVMKTLRAAIKTARSKSVSPTFDVLQRLNMSPKRYLKLLRQLIEQSQDRLTEIRKTLMSGDTFGAATLLDAITTASLTLGADELARVTTETAKALGVPDNGEPDLSPIEAALGTLRGTFEEIKADLAKPDPMSLSWPAPSKT
jgi:two-component system, chemotaxis family, chemotaxis protein CheY